MSQVNLSYDTVSKKLTAEMDGQPVENLDCVYFYSYSDENGNKYATMEIVTRTNSRENGTYEYHRTCANKQEKEGSEDKDFSKSMATILKH